METTVHTDAAGRDLDAADFGNLQFPRLLVALSTGSAFAPVRCESAAEMALAVSREHRGYQHDDIVVRTEPVA